MSEATIRADIKAILESVTSNIGVVYDYWRYATDWKAYIDLFKDKNTNRIFGWQIERIGVRTEVNENSASSYKKTHSYQITGFMSLIDSLETEKLFNAVVETVENRMLFPKKTGTADATEADKLRDADANFKESLIGKTARNVTDNTTATITGLEGTGILTIDSDIFESGEKYSIGLSITDADDFSTPQVNKIAAWTFGDVLCHKATITWPVMEYVDEPEEDAEDLLTLGLEYFLKPGDDTADASDIVDVS